MTADRPPVSGEPTYCDKDARCFRPPGHFGGCTPDPTPVSGEPPEPLDDEERRKWEYDASRPPVSGEPPTGNSPARWALAGFAPDGTQVPGLDDDRPPVSGEPRPDLWLKGYRMGYEDAQIEAEARATPALDVLTMVQAYANVEGAGAHDGKRRHPAPWVEHRVKSLLAEYARLAEQEGEPHG